MAVKQVLVLCLTPKLEYVYMCVYMRFKTNYQSFQFARFYFQYCKPFKFQQFDHQQYSSEWSKLSMQSTLETSHICIDSIDLLW